jgi:hypothetical protein
MFTWLGAVFQSIATSLVTGLVAVGLVSAPLPDMAATSTPVLTVEAPELATTTVSEIDLLREQLEQEKRLQTQKNQAETKATQAEAEAKRLQVELDSVKSKTVIQQNQAQTPQGTLCNGQYWASCPTGYVFICPVSGNATCTLPTSAADLNAQADRKVEVVRLANGFISALQTNDEFIKKELAFVAEIDYQLAGVVGGYQLDQEATNLIKQATYTQKDMFNQYLATNKKLVVNANGLLNIYSTTPAASYNEAFTSQSKSSLLSFTNSTSDKLYEMQTASTKYRQILDSYTQILNNLY